MALDPERLAAYIDGTLSSDERAEVERHLLECADCRMVVADAAAFVRSDESSAADSVRPPGRGGRRAVVAMAVLAAAAALVLAVRAVWPGPFSGRPAGRPELEELIAAVAQTPTRPAEGRLSGFAYAPMPGRTRSAGGTVAASPDVRIAVARIEKLAARNISF